MKKGQVIARLDRDQLLAQRERETAGLASARGAAGAGADGARMAAGDAGRRHRAAPAPIWRPPRRGWPNCRTARGRRRCRTPRRRWMRRRPRRTRAQKDWERAQTLYKNDDISTAQFDQFRSRFESAAGRAEAGAGARGAGAGRTARGTDRRAGRRRWSGRARRCKLAEANALELKRREQETRPRGAPRSARSQGAASR